TIVDDAADGGNSVVFGAGISAGELRLSTEDGYLRIETGTPGDRLRLAGFDASDPYAGWAVESYVFSDGQSLSYAELLDYGFALSGTPGGDVILGTGAADRISGFEGDDFIAGGAGDDTLRGGAGSDTYLFELSGGSDILIDADSLHDRNVLRFGEGIEAGDVSLRLENSVLRLSYGAGSDSISMPGVNPVEGGSAPCTEMRFADGSVVTLAEALAGGIEISGSAEAEVLIGFSGPDSLFGLGGGDVLQGGRGDDVYFIAPGDGIVIVDDVSAGIEYNSVRFLHGGLVSAEQLSLSFDRNARTLTVRVAGTSDGVTLTGFDPAEPLGRRAVERFHFVASGNEISYDALISRGFEVNGTLEGDYLEGSAAKDFLNGGDGDDVIAGGTGGDVADGGVGDDIYVFNRGDGVLSIHDEVSPTPQNTLVFGEGIALADLRNNLRFFPSSAVDGADGVLRIGLGGGDEIRIQGFSPLDAENGLHAVEHFEFADGTRVSYRDLVLNTFIVQGDAADDRLTGTNVQDRLYGFEGNDELYAGDGNDTLTGGTGDDLLVGGAGADMYVFNAGDGNDVIVDSGDNFDGNFIAFGATVDLASVTSARDGDDLLISYGSGDSIRVRGWSAARPAIGEMRTESGNVVTFGELQNGAPSALGTLEDLSVAEDQALNFVIPAGLFADPDGDPLTLSAALADGSALPVWLDFDPAAARFTGTPENLDNGRFEVRVTATDAYGAVASQVFALNVSNVNDAPSLTAPLDDQTAVEDQPFTLTLPEGLFTDVDAGDSLVVSSSLASGEPLPAWLGFNAAERSFSGTPGNADVGTLALRLTATDAGGLTASGTFTLTVANVNDDPVVRAPIAPQVATEDQPFSFTIPSGTFEDVDAGDALYSFATGAGGAPLPAWLSYDAATRTLSGTPENAHVGATALTLHA
ncbi:MAG: putative Ig domain-containing protein, partial [Phycisphaerales bacterium]|nr:putative Ig domain-containing protein [Phycisphaerales bacterium]